MESKQLYEKARKEYEAGKAILAEWEEKNAGKDVPKEKWAEVQKHFAEAKAASENAAQLAEAEEFERKQREPQRKHPLAEPGAQPEGLPAGTDQKEIARLQRKAFASYLRYGLSGAQWSEAEKKAISGLVDPAGGFLKMEEFRSQIINKLRDLVQLRARATTFSTNAESVAMPTADFSMSVPKRRRGGAVSVEDLQDFLGRARFTLHNRDAIVKVPEDMIDETEGDFMATLTGWIAQNYAEIEEDLWLNGSGVEEPIGLLTVTGFTDTAVGSNQGSGADASPEELRTVPYTLRAVHRRNAVWITHREGVKRAMLLRTLDGGAGTGAFIWQPSFAAGQPETIAGFPVLESEFYPENFTGGSTGDPLYHFGNPATYWIVDGRRLNLRRLDELYAEEGKVGIRMNAKVDGAPLHKDGFATLSHA